MAIGGCGVIVASAGVLGVLGVVGMKAQLCGAGVQVGLWCKVVESWKGEPRNEGYVGGCVRVICWLCIVVQFLVVVGDAFVGGIERRQICANVVR